MLPPNRVWRTYLGGKTLDTLEGKINPKDGHFPEDWIASTTLAVNAGRENIQEEGLSMVEIDGVVHKLKDIMERFPDDLLGPEHFRKYGANSQFLVKLLDSVIRLHIQAHPTVEFAGKYLQSNSGKTEAYIILGSRKDIEEPFIYLGFQHPIPREEFKNAVMNQDTTKLLSCFEKIPVRTGDVFIVPGGLPHAIGEGIFMIEIMEPTDFVVRLEFERGGYILPEAARFMGRSIDFAMDMIDFSPRKLKQIRQDYFCPPRTLTQQDGGVESILIDERQIRCFSVNRLKVTSRFIRSSNTFYVGIVTSGAGTITSGKDRHDLKLGSKFLVPVRTKEVEFATDTEMNIVLAFPPK